jgi:hypothetical protein
VRRFVPLIAAAGVLAALSGCDDKPDRAAAPPAPASATSDRDVCELLHQSIGGSDGQERGQQAAQQIAAAGKSAANAAIAAESVTLEQAAAGELTTRDQVGRLAVFRSLYRLAGVCADAGYPG